MRPMERPRQNAGCCEVFQKFALLAQDRLGKQSLGINAVVRAKRRGLAARGLRGEKSAAQ